MKAHKKKPLMESFREHIGKMIDRTDPIKLALLGATALLVYQTLKGSEGFITDLRKKVPLLEVGKDPTGEWLRSTFGTTFFANAEDISKENEGSTPFNLGEIALGITPEMLISILVAYLLVYEPRAVAEAFKSLGGGIVGFARSLGGITA